MEFSLVQLISACIVTFILAWFIISNAAPTPMPSAHMSQRQNQRRRGQLNPGAGGKDSDDDEDDNDNEKDYEDEDESDPRSGTADGSKLSADKSNSEWKLILVVRSDLEMGKGKIAAQCSHATLAAYTEMISRDKAGVKRWERWGQAKITLKCQSEEELIGLQKAARAKGLVAEIIRDAGRTQIAAGSRTVLAVGPGPKTLIDEVTGHLKLL